MVWNQGRARSSCGADAGVFARKGTTMDLIVDAVMENVGPAMEFVSSALVGFGVPKRARTKIVIALDEIMSNVCRYAYHDGPPGKVRVSVNETPNPGGETVSVVIEDSGMPFNPLHQKDPDTTADIDHRGIGGLGIFMVKQMMDDVKYEYVDGRNILTVFKHK